MQKFLAESRNGQKVFTDEENTNIGLHLIENPELLDLVEEVVRASEISGDNVGTEYDFGEIVGKTSCVKTTAKRRAERRREGVIRSGNKEDRASNRRYRSKCREFSMRSQDKKVSPFQRELKKFEVRK